MLFSISRRKGVGRKWRKRWPSKIDSNWDKHCCFADLVKKWPSNRNKKDSRFFENPQDWSSSDSERELGKEKDVCTFCSTIVDNWAKGRSSHILPRHYCDNRRRQNFFKKFIMGDATWRFAFNPETDRQCSEWVCETSSRPKKLNFQRSRIKTRFIISFDSPSCSAREIRNRGPNSKCIIL
jgi:hypothetical protein